MSRRTPCQDEDPELFFSFDPAEIAEAKQVCGSCQVRVACAQLAVKWRVQDGVWGGYDGEELRKLGKAYARYQRENHSADPT